MTAAERDTLRAAADVLAGIRDSHAASSAYLKNLAIALRAIAARGPAK
jgi:hypothetical protein